MKVAIANRGEVAVRIIQACREMGIPTVLLHSECDVKSRAYRMSDEQVCIGPASVKDSYLNAENVVRGALAAGATAIHPGFGFLSENAEFAELCLKNNIEFIGPRPHSIRAMGNKVSARALMVKAGVPVVPGYQGEDQNTETLLAEAKKIGFPIISKAANGGGGRGIKIVRTEKEFVGTIESAKREAKAAFGSDRIFLEKYVEGAKHIEFQIFGDCTGRVFHLFERECSVQRRHQKIIEEAQSPSLTEDLRNQMGEAAVRAATSVQYQGAGTVEFLFHEGTFYFMEMNTRLQVEHPVTESILSVDLVKAQLLTAQKKPLTWIQRQMIPRGHAIECRIYAENPYMGGTPSTGILGSCIFPEGPGRRFDFGFEKGDEITPYYDSMIAKVITWDENRERCIEKMLKVLDETIIFGVFTNIPFIKEILNHFEFRSGTMTTQFIEKYFSKPLPALELSDDEKTYAEKMLQSAVTVPKYGSTAQSPWTEYWRNV